MKKSGFFSVLIMLILVCACCFGATACNPSKSEEKAQITFDGNGKTGGWMAMQTITIGKVDNIHVNKYEKEGYVFVGWSTSCDNTAEYRNGEEIVIAKDYKSAGEFDVDSNGVITLYAVWKELIFNVYFDDGRDVETQTIKSNEKITKPENPTREGFTFKYWSRSANGLNEFDFNLNIKSEITLYAVWEENGVAVSFETFGIVDMPDVKVPNGQKLDYKYADIKATDYEFKGWYTDRDCTIPYNWDTDITKSFVLYAKWENLYHNVTFNFVGIDYKSYSISVRDGGAIAEPNVNLNGYYVGGWYTDLDCNNLYDWSNPITKQLSLYARVIKEGEKNSCLVTFMTDKGTAPASQEVVFGGKAKYPIEKPTNSDYKFVGWYTEKTLENIFNFDTPITSDIVLYAKHLKNPNVEVVQISLGGYAVDETQQDTYDKMVNEFNSTYGKYNGITVTSSIVGNWEDYQKQASTSLSTNGGFDVYMINDRNFKSWAMTRGDMIRNIGAGNDFTGSFMFDEQLDNMWSGIVDRFRVNPNGWTSYEDDDLWAVPIDANPTMLYYNRTVLENNGIIVISVEDITVTADNYTTLCAKYDGLESVGFDYAVNKTVLDLWNEDLIADLFGSKHNNLRFANDRYEDEIRGYNNERITLGYLSNVDIPAKGFYRSIAPRNTNEYNTYVPPYKNEVLVFNASITMSWDEIEDVAMICTKRKNFNSASTYGFFTQWWYSYVYGVGGHGLLDTTGDGAWAFGISDYTANYLVTENACTQSNPNNPNDPNRYYIGAYTGKLYSAGDILDFLDKIDVERLIITQSGSTNSATSGDIILPNRDGSFNKYNIDTGVITPIGKGVSEVQGNTDNSAIRKSIVNKASQDQHASGIYFVELPSTKEAFTRFCHLHYSDVDEESIGVSYATSPTFSDETADITKLGNGTVAFVIEKGDKLGHLRNVAREYNQSWGIANIPIFKEYANHRDPNDDTVKRMGVPAGHSEVVALGISAGCPNEELDAAWRFIQWMSADYFYVDSNGYTYFGDQRSPTDVRYRAGQAVKADSGYIPNQPALFENPDQGGSLDKTSFIQAGEENLNLHLFAYALEYEKTGDWGYLPSNTWINEWATTLSAATGVRGGQMSVASWFSSGIINKTNQVLAKDFSNFYNAANIIDQWEKKLGVDISW